jgi:hypothetical protein
MADTLGTRGQRDRFRVNILHADEVRAWCEELGCTPEALKAAVGRAGVMAVDVQLNLKDPTVVPNYRGRGVQAH